MLRTSVLVFLLALCGFSGSIETRGIHPRPSRTEYSVTTFTESLAVAATMVAPEHVKRIFGPDVARRYLVIEIGFYPKLVREFSVKQSDFKLRFRASREPLKMGTPEEIVEQFRTAPALELSSKSLPDGPTSRPVAGYLYFPVSEVLQYKNAYELDYTGNGAWMTLPLP